MTQQYALATLGGGCFWCLEAVFDDLQGIIRVESGYAGGHVANPTYEEICGKKTGHAEVVRLTYDPSVINFSQILDVFFTIHDPTTLNRQGYDVGPQYRSAIFYHDAEQKAVAEQTIAALNASGQWPDPIVTEVTPINNYYEAEDYHQEYFAHNPFQPYCMAVVSPKVQKFRKEFSKQRKS
ncbi:MAG TPA: peptide-methionine (S)-S-oxide reductase [Herpetosiphon sp.]|uniref:Peptide methionine sulfoxide reductase MsrA n=1 Tax=Herpetosiphon aurantiacus (strain ATCC 23779 / DSM 785 / 114-95) TaxID=316274 RepID=A9B6T4_HERA2|nr:peptide-methionine (S)-S-oxide reductase MsrA [Herpetosiphon sp.]ABX04393.1 peptide methionine sulfoxide reductase [Herpetosiphon aurantiacus DSM 785]HBW52353.1 peptide-methionine (S)-S-oxide reductase [Herpetosiphon sp.]